MNPEFISLFFLQILLYIFWQINQKYKGAKNNSIKMDIVLSYKTTLDDLNESDEEALHLFNNLNPNEFQFQQQRQSELPNPSDESVHLPRKLSKLNKRSKNHHKKQKQKEKEKRQMSKHQKLMMDMLNAATPKKKRKRERNQEKSDQYDHQNSNEGNERSSQFDISNCPQNLDEKLNQLNPDLNDQAHPIKRLRKSNKKNRFEQKEGFKVEQLGLNPEFNFEKLSISHEDDDDYSENQKRRLRKKKADKKVLTNEEMMNSIKNHGVVESEGEQQIGAEYDNGLNMLYSMKDKKKNGIKINNRMFGDLNIDIKDEQSQMVAPQNLQLQLKPKSLAISQQRLSFLSKAETIKKQRGMEAEVNQQQYNLNAQQKAKRSIAKMVSSFGSQQFQDEIDLEVKIPTIARGKSADIINNTEYLKRFMNKSNQIEKDQNFPLRQSKSESFNANIYKKNSVSRVQLFKQMQQQTRFRRSKYISDEQIKNSFKKTNLQELEEARKRIQQKKRKEALDEEESESDSSIDQNCLDDEMRELIEKQEFICGDFQHQGDVHQQDRQSQLEELEIEVNLSQGENPQKQRLQINIQEKAASQIQQESQKQDHEDIDQHNQIIDELASASQCIHSDQPEDQIQEEHIQKDENDFQPQQQENNINEDDHKYSNQPESELDKMDEIQERQAKQMEEQGIILIKNRRNTNKINQKYDQQTQKMDHLIQQTIINKENCLDVTNKLKMFSQVSPDKVDSIKYENEEQFNNFRKLRKIALVIAHKKEQRERGRKYAQQFIENQAQEGSDNEDHDDMIKKIDYQAQEKQYDGMDLDQDLIELIDNAVDINEQDQHEAFRKYLQDVRIQDRDQIKKIIRGQFKRKHQDLEIQVEEDEKLRKERMDQVMNWIKKREDQEGDGIFAKDPEVKEHNSDQDDSQFVENKKNIEEDLQQSESQKQPMAEQNARLDKFLEDILPPNKKQLKTSKLIDLGPVPESVKLQKSSSNKTISLSRLGGSCNELKPVNRIKKTSSLINQILNKSYRFKMPLKTSIKSTAKK